VDFVSEALSRRLGGLVVLRMTFDEVLLLPKRTALRRPQ